MMHKKGSTKILTMFLLFFAMLLTSCQVKRGTQDSKYGTLFFPLSDDKLAFIPADCLITGSQCPRPQVISMCFDLFCLQSDVTHWRRMAWSHSGTKALILVYGPPNWDEVFLFDPQSHTLQSLIRMAYIDDVAWSHDDKWLAITGVKEGKDASTTEVQIALSSIFLISSDGAEVRNLAEGLHGMKHHLSWLDQDTLLFELDDYPNGYGMYTLNIQNGKWAELPGESLNSVFPQPSPDGQQIVYGNTVNGKANGYIMDADGSNRKSITESEGWVSVHPSWSPDQKWISLNVMSTTETLESAVYIVRPDGTNLQKIYYQKPNLVYGTWSPVVSSQLLVTERDNMGDIAKWLLVTVPDGNVTIVPNFYGDPVPQWLSWRPPANIHSDAY